MSIFTQLVSRNRCKLLMLSRAASLIKRSASKNVTTYDDDDVDPSKPIKFSTSEASGWNVRQLRVEDISNNLPRYKAVIFSLTIMIFYVYLKYRKRTDMDDELEMPLGKRVLWINEQLLLDEKKKLQQAGSTTVSVDEELAEIERLRVKYNYK